MQASERVKLARYFNGRGVRMLKCSNHVESCGHHKAFKASAANYFDIRNQMMASVRAQVGKRKVFLYQIESLDFEGRCYGDFHGHDELEAGAEFERQCEGVGVDPGMYRAVLYKRVRP